jgi:hypothetical protein
MAGHQHMVAGHLSGEPLLLRAGYQVIHQDPQATVARRAERVDQLDQFVDAVLRLDDYRQFGQLGSPDVLQQLGIVPTFDPDAAGPGNVRTSRRAGEGSAVGHTGRLGRSTLAHQGDRPTFDQEAARLVSELPSRAVSIAQRDGFRGDRHDITAEPRCAVFDDQTNSRRN